MSIYTPDVTEVAVAAPAPHPDWRRYWGVLPVLAVLGAVYLVVPPWTHLHPLNDSFTYIQATQRFVETGELRLNDQISATFVAQAFWGALFLKLFGDNLASLSFATMVAGFVAVAGAYVLARVAGGRQAVSILVGLSLAANPLFINLSYSFMTDLPFLALIVWASVCFVVVLRRDVADRRELLVLLAVGGVLCGLAYLVRQLGLVFPSAAVVTLWLRRQLDWKTASATLAGPVAAFVGYMLWYHITQAGAAWADGGAGSGGWGSWLLQQSAGLLVIIPLRLIDGLQYMALFCAPLWLPRFVAWLREGPRLRLSRPPIGRAIWLFVLTIYSAFILFFHWGVPVTLLSNILARSGYLMELNNGEAASLYLPGSMWLVVQMIALPASFWLGIELVAASGDVRRLVMTRMRSKAVPPMRGVDAYLLLCVAALAVLTFGYVTAYDRYLLPFVPLLAVLLFVSPQSHPVRRAAFVIGYGWIVLLALFGVYAMSVFRAWNDSRWAAAAQLLDQGVPAAQIDAGYDWDGWYLAQTWSEKAHAAGLPPSAYPWHAAWAANDGHAAYVLSWKPLPGYTVIQTVHFARFFGEAGTLYSLKYTTSFVNRARDSLKSPHP